MALFSFKLEVIPNKSSAIVGENCELYIVLSHRITFSTNDFVKEQGIKAWLIDSFSPQKQHLLSVLIPYLNISFFVTTILWMNLKWNSFSFVSLQSSRIDLNMFVQCSSFKESILLHLLRLAWPPMWVLSMKRL